MPSTHSVLGACTPTMAAAEAWPPAWGTQMLRHEGWLTASQPDTVVTFGAKACMGTPGGKVPAVAIRVAGCWNLLSERL
jgi:hypothetical protein